MRLTITTISSGSGTESKGNEEVPILPKSQELEPDN